MRGLISVAAASIVGLFVCAGFAAAAPTLISLGTLPGGENRNSEALGISGDGRVVVGWSDAANGLFAFRWTKGGGMQSLGLLPGAEGQSQALGVSADGSTVVGFSSWPGGTRAFRWTASSGMQNLGVLAGTSSSIAYAVSADGAVVVGSSLNLPFRWTATEGMQPVSLPLGWGQASVRAVSADGSILAGFGDYPPLNGMHRALRWNAGGEIQDLGDVPDWLISEALGISSDGSIVVGYGFRVPGGASAFRWTSAAGTQGLVETDSRAYAVSGDGLTIVGAADDGPFLWTQSQGMVSLTNYLMGVNLQGLTVTGALGLSYNGSAIVGTGRNADGHNRAWVIVPPCGDASGDGVVNFIDITSILSNWGTASPFGDANNDGVVNFADITFVLARWGEACP